MSRHVKPRVMHLELDREMTRCGQLVEGLETSVSSGTRDVYLETTQDRAAVTCKRCKRSIESEERNNR